jgi:hypothetical protein
MKKGWLVVLYRNPSEIVSYYNGPDRAAARAHASAVLAADPKAKVAVLRVTRVVNLSAQRLVSALPKDAF